MRERIIWLLIMITLLGLMVNLSICDNYLIQKQMMIQAKTEDTDNTNNKKASDKATQNQYFNQNEENLILVIGTLGNLKEGGKTPIYARAEETSEILADLQYNCAVIICKEYLQEGREYNWIPVELPNMKRIGYVKSEQVEIESIKIGNATDDDIRNQILEDAVSYIGLRFVRYGKSLDSGIDCSNFVQKIYEKEGIDIDNTPNGMKKQSMIITENEALPGDIVYYEANEGGGHVGIYLGNGLIINSAGHEGKVYPEGGVRICRLQYHDREEYEFCKIIQ